MAKLKYKKKLKYAMDLEAGDIIKIGGNMCEVVTSQVGLNVMNMWIRVKVIGATPNNERAHLTFPRGMPVNTYH